MAKQQTSERIKVLLIEDDAGDALIATEILTRGGFEVEHVIRLGDALRRLALANVDLVLLDLSLPDSVGLDTYLRLHADAPWAPVVIMTGTDDEAVAAHAITEGAQDYIVKGHFSPQSLQRALRFALERQQHTTPNLSGGMRVVSVIGPKGGVGKTTVAINVAAALLQLEKRPVSLIDLSLQSGDLGMMLNLNGEHTIVDFCNMWPDVNEERLEDILEIGPRGLPRAPSANPDWHSELVRSEHLTWILNSLSQRYSNVIVDHSSYLTDVACDVLDRSDRILFVLDLHMAAAKTLMTTLAFFRAMRLSTSKVMLVVNRGDERTNFNLSDVENTLRFPDLSRLAAGRSAAPPGRARRRPGRICRQERSSLREYRKLAALIQSEPTSGYRAA